MTPPILVVGAGISGATLARRLAEAGQTVRVIDERDHVAGNCHTEVDPDTGVLVHRYGPHILHTDDERVWDFLSRFCTFMPYRHRVFAIAGGQVYRLPLNLHTLAQVFGRPFTPGEARTHIAGLAEASPGAADFESRALGLMGRQLYELFFRGYTAKQWGRDPSEVPGAILKRLPFRFDFDDNYFHHTRQAMPRDGYTEMITRMLDHRKIELMLGCRYEEIAEQPRGHLFYTGPIDRFFDCRFGHLDYRTLCFETLRGGPDIQGTPVINYCDADVAQTRITEHRHLAPWRPAPERSIASIETSHTARPGDIPYYPVRGAGDLARLDAYRARVAELADVTFLGRLGSYAYIDMDQACAAALDVADAYLAGPAGARR